MNMYQEHMLDHYREPRHWGELQRPTFTKVSVNSLCGDRLKVTGIVKSGILREVAFTSEGCLISRAAASILLEYASGKLVKELAALTNRNMLALIGIPLTPARTPCGLLAWQALTEVLDDHKHWK